MRKARLWIGAILLAGILLAGGASASTPYDVRVVPTYYERLPIGGGSASLLPLSASQNGHAPLVLPFPMRFFDVDYFLAAVGTNGLLTFGPLSGANCLEGLPNCANAPLNLAIPSSLTPNRLIAGWWDQLTCEPWGIQTQLLGAAPHRELVIQWGEGCHGGLYPTNVISMQIWLREGTTTIEVRYGRRSGVPGFETASVGIMSPVADGSVEGNVGLGCTPSCGVNDWPADTAILYVQGPDLAVEAIVTPEEGNPGLPLLVTSTIRNVGGSAAAPSSLRYLLSSTPLQTAASIELEGALELPGLEPGEEVILQSELLLPEVLAPGDWYILAEADPHELLADRRRANNFLASPPLRAGQLAPDLAVVSLDAPTKLTSGGEFTLDWVAQNLGNRVGSRVPYAVVLSPNEGLGPTDRRLLFGEITVPRLEELAVSERVRVPADVATGVYHLGILIDPDDQVFELDEQNNSLASPQVWIRSSELLVRTAVLPVARLGIGFCVELEAEGGDGVFLWSEAEAGTLPPGLELVALPEEGASLLCGRPTALGTFAFRLEVRSAGLVASRLFELRVEESRSPLAITTSELPAASFREPFDVQLRGLGGVPPYHWSLREGALPAGLGLDATGRILGEALDEGLFSFTVGLADSEERSVEQRLDLLVGAPGRLSCATLALPPHGVGEAHGMALVAAGGTKPYHWTTRGTRRLGDGPAEEGESLGPVPPPGLSLSAAGWVSGAPLLQGRYEWTVEVMDASRSQELCPLSVEVVADRGLSVLSRTLPEATVGHPFRIRLQATGGVGALRWRLLAGSRLPDGLVLEPSGLLEGYPTGAGLEGEPSREYAFLVEVRDEADRRGLAPLSINVVTPRAEPVDEETRTKTGGGCRAGDPGAGILPWALGASLLWLRGRGRSRPSRHQL